MKGHSWPQLSHVYGKVGLAGPLQVGRSEDCRGPDAVTSEQRRQQELPAGFDVRAATPARELLVITDDDILHQTNADKRLRASNELNDEVQRETHMAVASSRGAHAFSSGTVSQKNDFATQ